VFSLLEGILPEYAYRGIIRERTGNIAHNSARTNAYPCSDGTLVCIAANTTSLFRTLAEVIGRDDYLCDPDLQTNEGRVARAAEIDAAIAGWTRSRSSAEVVENLRAREVPVEPNQHDRGNRRRRAISGARDGGRRRGRPTRPANPRARRRS
jgi:formyl-CoA transferase